MRRMTATWVALITRSRIISNQQYIPCSLYQMCLVRDSALHANHPGTPWVLLALQHATSVLMAVVATHLWYVSIPSSSYHPGVEHIHSMHCHTPSKQMGTAAHVLPPGLAAEARGTSCRQPFHSHVCIIHASVIPCQLYLWLVITLPLISLFITEHANAQSKDWCIKGTQRLPVGGVAMSTMTAGIVCPCKW